MLPIIIAIIAGIVGIVSVKYLGSNNEVEEVAETVIEKELGLPNDAVDLDKYATKP